MCFVTMDMRTISIILLVCVAAAPADIIMSDQLLGGGKNSVR